MEIAKKKIAYSIIRYSPDEIKGEVINIGLLFHNFEDTKVKFFLLDEKSFKIRALIDNEVELRTYKSFKDVFEYYIDNCRKDMSGIVGEKYIASYYEEDFVQKVYKHYLGKEIFLSKVNYAFTKDENKLFEVILKRYIGESNIDIEKTSTLTAKKYLKQIINNNENLAKRVKSDVIIKPIKELEDFEVKIDFTFKNGVWNYMQTIPKITNKNKNADWFSKIQLILDSELDMSKIHLVYKKSDILLDSSTLHLLNYLKTKYSNLSIYDIDEKMNLINLCSYIEAEAQVFEDAV